MLWWCFTDGAEDKTPESLEYGVSSFTFEASRPFHPQRFYDAMTNREGTAMESLVRAKGLVWWPTVPDNTTIAAFAGKRFTLDLGGSWFVCRDREDWPEGVEEMIHDRWTEEYGDRAIEMVFIGVGMMKDEVMDILESCVLSDEEFAAGYEELWHKFDDPFAAQWEAMEKMLEEHNHEDHDHATDDES